MTSLDFDASMKHIFIILHFVFLAGGAGYLYLGQNQIAIFFAVSSVASLIYYEMYQNRAILLRLQAHLNLIEEAVQDSEEFKEGVSKKKEGEKQENLEDKLFDLSVEEATEFIDNKVEEIEEQEKKVEFLNKVKEAEEEGQNRLGVKNHANEKLLGSMRGIASED